MQQHYTQGAQPLAFRFDDFRVRTIHEGGEVWFVAADVCAVLEIRNHWDAVSRLDEDEKGLGSTETLGGEQEISIISEAGLYRLIFTSRKEGAKRFTRWVTHEVLPAIRRHGYYADHYVHSGERLTLNARNTYIREINSLTEKLAGAKDAMVLQQHHRALEHYCRLAGWPMPDVSLRGVDPRQLPLISQDGHPALGLEVGHG